MTQNRILNALRWTVQQRPGTSMMASWAQVFKQKGEGPAYMLASSRYNVREAKGGAHFVIISSGEPVQQPFSGHLSSDFVHTDPLNNVETLVHLRRRALRW